MFVPIILCVLALPAFIFAFLYGFVSTKLIDHKKVVKKQRLRIIELEEQELKLEEMVKAQEKEIRRVDTIRKRTEEGCMVKALELEEAQADLVAMKQMIGTLVDHSFSPRG